MQPTTTRALIESYEGLLLDAYGVLVDAQGALPGAHALVQALADSAKPWAVVTNDASRSPETVARRFAALGLPILADRIVTSGSLIAPYFDAHGLRGAGCLVLGPADSVDYARAAGARILSLSEAGADSLEVLVVADETGFDFLQGVDRAMSMMLARLDRRLPLHLLLPNPDLIYPKSPGEFGVAAGGAALLLEAAARLRHGASAPEFVRLGKPHTAIFEEGLRRLGTRRVVMIGDQLETDVRGALRAGLDAAWLTTGVSRAAPEDPAVRPTWSLASLR